MTKFWLVTFYYATNDSVKSNPKNPRLKKVFYDLEFRCFMLILIELYQRITCKLQMTNLEHMLELQIPTFPLSLPSGLFGEEFRSTIKCWLTMMSG